LHEIGPAGPAAPLLPSKIGLEARREFGIMSFYLRPSHIRPAAGGDLFVATDNAINEYTTSGAVVAAPLITGLDDFGVPDRRTHTFDLLLVLRVLPEAA
jgi:hypothetical protein